MFARNWLTLDSEAGVRPVQTANLHSSPSTCSVMPMSLVWKQSGLGSGPCHHCLSYLAYHHLHLILVLGFPIRVFHFLGEDEIELEEEHSPLSTLPDELLGVPDVESVLEDDVAQQINTYITAVQEGQMECVIGLES